MNPPDNYNFSTREWRRTYFFLANFYAPCKTCENSGLIYFEHDGKHYPNAPCPVCRYDKLLHWCDRWFIERKIARYLRNQHIDESNRFVRGKRGFHRRIPLSRMRSGLGGKPQPGGGGLSHEESSERHTLVPGSASGGPGVS